MTRCMPKFTIKRFVPGSGEWRCLTEATADIVLRLLLCWMLKEIHRLTVLNEPTAFLA